MKLVYPASGINSVPKVSFHHTSIVSIRISEQFIWELVLAKDKKGIVRAFATALPTGKSQAEILLNLYGNR